MKQKKFYTEAAYVLALFILSFGTALMERADFGVGMVVAPSYILHLEVSRFLPFFSFGVAEFTVQALVIVLTMLLLRRVRPLYLFAFVSAMLSGITLDLAVAVIGLIPFEGFGARLVYFVSGMVLGSAGVAFMFNTYIPPGAYEQFVKELTAHFGLNVARTKTVYDVSCLVIGVVMSFAFFGLGVFNGIGWGTLVSAVFNGSLIGMFNGLYKKVFSFQDGLPLRKFFDKLR